MWRRGIISLIVVALGTCMAAAGQPARFVQGDIIIMGGEEPNDPNSRTLGSESDPNQTWDPAQHVAAVWESVSADLSATIYNPALPPTQMSTRTRASRRLSMSGQITITDSNGLVGFCTTATAVRTVDQDGNVIPGVRTLNETGRLYMAPGTMTRPGAPDTKGVSAYVVSIGLDSASPVIAYPSLLKKVEWSMYALVAGTFQTADVPLAVTNEWIELVPGLEVFVEQSAIGRGEYQYRIKARCDPKKVSYVPGSAIHLSPGDLPPEVIVAKIDVLDAHGISIPAQGIGSFSSTSAEAVFYTSTAGVLNKEPGGISTGSGSCAVCGTATTIRYTLGLKSYEKEVRFTLENVPVPSF
jgi:hypothetical protein